MTDGERLRVLIADDEPLARVKLKDMLACEPGVDVAGECRNGLEVVKAVTELQPDLVLLDIQMPEMSGLDAVRAIGVERMPLTAFVTAFGDFAVEAFEIHALDYLLKPYDQARLQQSLARARAAIGSTGRSHFEAELRAFLRRMSAATPYVQRFLVRRPNDYLFVRTSEIEWIQSADNYVTLHSGGRKFMVRDTLSGVEEQLDPEKFLRIRASAIINLERVVSIRPWSSTEFQFVFEDGTTVTSSRRFRDRIRTVIP